MSSHYYYTTLPGVKAGIDGVTKGTISGGTNFELRVDDGITGNNRLEIIRAIGALINFVTTDTAPA